MLNTILNFIKNHLALIISVISIFLSIYNFLYTIFTKHKKLEFEIVKYKYLPKSDCKIYQFQFIIVNKSQLPISISNLCVNDIYCKFDPTRITDKISTVSFPISLNSLEAKTGWLEFKTEKEIDIYSMYFNLYTSRGLCENIVPKLNNIVDASPCHKSNYKL